MSDRQTYSTEYVRSLFDEIAPRYDLLNHLLSSGIDVYWRKKAISLLRNHRPQAILDVATGTGDFAIEATRLRPQRVVGIDLAPAMLERAKRKTSRRNLATTVSFVDGQAEHLPFHNESFDTAIVAFGVRNFSDLSRGLDEMVRVIRPGGVVLVLEFSNPRSSVTRALYSFYSRRILPAVGGSLSRKEAYEYLPRTIREFPDGEVFAALLRQSGLDHIRIVPLTFGIVTIYYGIKDSSSAIDPQHRNR